MDDLDKKKSYAIDFIVEKEYNCTIPTIIKPSHTKVYSLQLQYYCIVFKPLTYPIPTTEKPAKS